jgi:hypothetical protein
MHYIYLTINLINNKKYIGQRKLPCNISHYKKDKYLGSGTILFNAIKKYGRENFKKEILDICDTQKEADRLEIEAFEKYKVLDKKNEFYNRALPGQFRRHPNHSENMSKIMKNFYSDTGNKMRFYKKIARKNGYKNAKDMADSIKSKEEKKKTNIDRIKKIGYKRFGMEIYAEQMIKKGEWSQQQADNYLNRRIINKPKESLSTRATKQWANNTIREKMVTNMKGADKKKSHYMRFKNKINKSYVEKCICEAGLTISQCHPRLAKIFYMYTRNQYKSTNSIKLAMEERRELLKDHGIIIDIDRMIIEYPLILQE